MPLIAPLDAHRLAADAGRTRPMPARTAGLREPGRLHLAAPLHALADVPAYRSAAMDGYAVRGPGPWQVRGAARPGSPYTGTALEPGDAVRIATGAVVPPGADRVVPWERTGTGPDGTIFPAMEPENRLHIREPGETHRRGALLASAGAELSPALRSLAAWTGHDQVQVRVQPRVAVIVTGSELDTAGAPAAGRVRDALGPLLSVLVPELGGQVVSEDYVPDDPGALGEALRARAADADVVVTTGMASHGEADHLRGVLADLGGQVLVPGVDIRPGKPQLLAALRGQPVLAGSGRGPLLVGLPGNPGAAMAACALLLAPVLAGMVGSARCRWVRLMPEEDRAFAGRAGRRWQLVSAGRNSSDEAPDSPAGAALADGLIGTQLEYRGWPLDGDELVLIPPRDAPGMPCLRWIR
ncbi:molybdopterin molybdotransferase MoeA [Sediminivirga luteola]|uniref:Molybdopterin molybdenumtransferase n=1 Tax=Sediminivirga luteola TaxID=1774748 RepID=A0A8J2U1B9_9MICO|nr:molybdopterin-binding protein [Sediminivirga luteola]MCI2265643.1 molybdopterin-binding protein [Sediminivirga luteola]GGA28251.1 hypothetical protein GCM10011333_33770 [Sediminivirga luteola]